MSKKRIIKGLILIFAGIVFLLNHLGYVDFTLIWYAFNLWPLGLIALGISMIFNNE